MKNFIAIVCTILIVLACAYGIYKQIDNFNKENEARGISYVNTDHGMIF